ncbi:MAG: LysM peptidoglycan-binding domain-containing protein [Candidatus Schekmanbacteria bacterium]|nr:LysM peptidoglycan-binding domain-containing protein [Candidatus Schekmanbacteria bacterium]
MRKFSLLLIILILLTGGCAWEKLSSDYWDNNKVYVLEGPPLPPADYESDIAEADSNDLQVDTEPVPEVTLPENPPNKELEELFVSSDEFYNKGVKFTQEGKWELAEDEFENALELLQNSELKDNYPDEVNNFYNQLSRNVLDILEKKESEDVKTREEILLARIRAKPEEERTIREKVMLDFKEIDYDLPLEINDKVIKYIEFFSTDVKSKFQTWLSRSNAYLPILRKILKEEGLPLDLAYLPLIESGFNTRAYSKARAGGMWQFIPGTGKKYGLDINWWVDERRDFEKSTHSAAAYLKFLYESFGSWYLALASYNAGEGRVAKSIQSQDTADFWSLRLPRETMNYVPAFIASVIVAKNPQRYGLEVEYEKPLEYDTITLDRPIDLDSAAKCAETEKEEIKHLNPEITYWSTPPVASYQLRIPGGKSEVFAKNFEEIKDSFSLAFVKYTVQKNETLKSISRKFGVPSEAIIAANHIKKPSTILAGTQILVPNKWAGQGKKTTAYASSSPVKGKKGELSVHTVRNGDTLFDLARAYGTSTESIMKWNNLKSSALSLNQKLKIYSGTKAGESQKTATKVASSKQAAKTKQDNYILHSVKKGETLSVIAKKYGVTIPKIMQWNKIKSATSIQPSQKIIIYPNLVSSLERDG